MSDFTKKSITKLHQEREALLEEIEQIELKITETENDDEKAALIEQSTARLQRIKVIDGDIERQDAIRQMLQKTPQRDEKPAPTQLSLPEKEEDKVKVKIPATAIRVPCHSFRAEKLHGMDREQRAFGFGRFALATAARTQPGLFGHLAHYITKHEDAFGPMNAATEGGAGGAYVPTEFSSDLISLMESYGVARQLLDVQTMTSDKKTIPKEGADPVPVFVGEGTAGSDVSPTDDRQVTLTAKKLMAILINSSELQEDAIMEFGNSLMRRMANGFATKEDQCAWLGDGTSTYGGMVGFNTLLQSIDGAGTDAAGLTTGAAGTDSAYTSFTLANFESVTAALPHYAETAENNAVWVCHRSFYFTAMASLMNAAGGMTSELLQSGVRRPLFMGWPVVFANHMPSTPAATQLVCTFGDHRRAASFGDRRAYTVDFSREASVGSVDLWSSDQIGIRATERFDVVCHSLGDATNAGAVCGLETVT